MTTSGRIQVKGFKNGPVRSVAALRPDGLTNISPRKSAERGMSTSLKEKLIKGAVAGTISATASAVVFGERGNTNVFGVNMPIPAAIGITNAAASVGADLAHEYIFPHIPGNEKYAAAESAALGLAVSGFGTAYLLNRENLQVGTFMNGAALGAGSYALADWIDGRFLGGVGDVFM